MRITLTHNFITTITTPVKTSSLGYNTTVDLGVICNVNVAGGVVLSTSLCQHGGGKGPCANTDNVEQCL